jgi:hypothetical protein
MKNVPLDGVLISDGIKLNSVIGPSIISGITTGGVEDPTSFLEQEIKVLSTRKITGNRYILIRFIFLQFTFYLVFFKNMLYNIMPQKLLIIKSDSIFLEHNK